MKPWKDLLTDYWTGYFETWPEIALGCTVEGAVADSLYQDFNVFCEWNEIEPNLFFMIANGETAKLRKLANYWFRFTLNVHETSDTMFDKWLELFINGEWNQTALGFAKKLLAGCVFDWSPIEELLK